MINFFDLGTAGRLVDLPGYGYAAVPQALRATWDALVGGYLANRPSLAIVVLLMDIRHPLTRLDREFLEWLRPVPARRLVLLTKCDKLSRAARLKALAETRAALERTALGSEIRLFSSHSGEGVEEVRDLLEAWLADAGAQRRK